MSAELTADSESRVPSVRVRSANALATRDGDWVLYWMISARRPRWNFALERALEWGRRLRKPVLVFEPLRLDYPWASRRLHRFVLDGMAHSAGVFARHGVAYFPYVEPEVGEGKGLLAALAGRAARVVTDEFPGFFLPRMVAHAAATIRAPLEVVDSNGLVPLRAPSGEFATAMSFRRWLQAHLAEHLRVVPLADPLERHAGATAEVPAEIERRWPRAPERLLAGEERALAELPLEASVAPVATRGGSGEAQATLAEFVQHKLARYHERRNHPDAEGSSGLSPYLHFGHVAAHEAFAAVAGRGWSAQGFPRRTDGRRGWFGLPEAAEEFLEQLVTWRELGFVFAHHRSDHEHYESLPDWARATLEASCAVGRPSVSLEDLEAARSQDPLWNAAQTELLRTGRLHNAMRMLWGKKILEWSPSPREALARMIHLNNKYALDGRDPNSYSGIFWCLGRFDRPWGPRRPGFGTVRYMSSASARRKLELEHYLERFAPPGSAQPDLLEAPAVAARRKPRRR